MYKIQCECGKQLRVAFGQAKMHGRCPSCARTFIIPAPAELTTGRLKCRCGLVMEYDYKDAGSLCQCSQCNALFKIPGGMAESMSSELDRELQLKMTEAKKSGDQVESIPQNPVFESLGDSQPSTQSPIRADYEAFGFGKLLAGVALLFLACVSLAALAMWAQGTLKLPNNWVLEELSVNGKPNEDARMVTESPLTNEKTPVRPEKLPQPLNSDKPKRWVKIGEMPPSVSPIVPESIGKSFTPTPLTNIEVEQLANKIVAAMNNNSSEELTALMDAEVIGNYLFQHAKLPVETRFQLGSEALALYANHSRLSEQLPSAQAFPPIRIGESTIPLIRICNNAYQKPLSLEPTIGLGQMGPGTPSVPAPKIKGAIGELVEEYDRIRLVIHNQLPIRFRRTAREEQWKDLQFQRTPLNKLLDYSALYFAVITTRNRAGKPVLLDLACVNQDLCLFETTWNSIDENTEKKSFDCSRPPNQTEKYFSAFRESVGDKTMNDIFKANFALRQVKLAKYEAGVATGFLEESKMPQPSTDDCLDALENLERLFPNDTHNIMLQYLTAHDAKLTNEARQLFKRLVEMKFSNISFYDFAIGPYGWYKDVEMARKTVDALKLNCLR